MQGSDASERDQREQRDKDKAAKQEAEDAKKKVIKQQASAADARKMKQGSVAIQKNFRGFVARRQVSETRAASRSRRAQAATPDVFQSQGGLQTSFFVLAQLIMMTLNRLR